MVCIFTSVPDIFSRIVYVQRRSCSPGAWVRLFTITDLSLPHINNVAKTFVTQPHFLNSYITGHGTEFNTNSTYVYPNQNDCREDGEMSNFSLFLFCTRDSLHQVMLPISRS